MLCACRKSFKNFLPLFALYLLCFIGISTNAYAISNSSNSSTYLNSHKIAALIQRTLTTNELQVSATPEVVNKLQQIRASEQARKFMRMALTNMAQYQPMIQAELQKRAMPNDLLVLPLIESGYRPLAANVNPVQADGIWQIIPATAQRFGLSVGTQHDERMNAGMATQAALTYLQSLYGQFQDWKLAAMAYEYGENELNQLINTVGSRNPWTLAHAASAPKEMKDYLALLDSAILIMHNPTLVSEQTKF